MAKLVVLAQRGHQYLIGPDTGPPTRKVTIVDTDTGTAGRVPYVSAMSRGYWHIQLDELTPDEIFAKVTNTV